jgi:hypothetical protein
MSEVPSAEQVVDQKQLSSPLGDSSAQRAAESVILAQASTVLGTSLKPRRLYLAEGVRIEVDGVSDDPPILCEVWAHQGPAKTAQTHKVLHDALKLFVAGRSMPTSPRLILVFAHPLAASRFTGRSWYAHALRDLSIEILVVDISDDLRAEIRAAQERQFR